MCDVIVLIPYYYLSIYFSKKKWKVNNGEIEVVPLVVKPSNRLSVVKIEITI